MRAMPAHPSEEIAHPAVRGHPDPGLRLGPGGAEHALGHRAGMAILIATGLYIANPFGFPGTTPSPHFLMGWVRVVHVYTAIFFTLAVLVRLVWFFISPALYARWKQFIPGRGTGGASCSPCLKFYLFFRARPPDVIGHNPLAGLAYVGVFLLYLLMITSGLALYAAQRAARRVHEELPVPHPNLRRPPDGALRPPPGDVVADRLRRPPRVLRRAHLGPGEERRGGLDLLRLQVRSPGGPGEGAGGRGGRARGKRRG